MLQMKAQDQHSSLEIISAQRVGLEDDFLLLGWCPHQVRRLQQVFTPKTLAFLKNIDRRIYRPNNHSICIEAPKCIANNVNLKEYNTAHTPSCVGSCPPLEVDYSAIVTIIRDGGVPLVSIHIDAGSNEEAPHLKLRITPRMLSSRYTALSHVWFDGLGNPSANALPTCQVQRLYTQLLSQPRDFESGVVKLGPLGVDWPRQSFVLHPERQPPLFWMDTLCIPVGDAEKELRLKAINQMASIYAAAVQVLVLDAELMQCEIGIPNATETLARIACSAWMTRSWTLQEGVLARECVFQFKDRAIDPVHEWCHHGERFISESKTSADAFPSQGDSEGWLIYKELYDRFWDTLHQDWKSKYRRDPPTPDAYKANGGAVVGKGRFRGSQAVGKVHTLPSAQGLSQRGKSGLDDKDHFTLDLGEERRLKQLVDTWNELAHRSTTMPEDLHVIVSNLLDFNADKIMKLPTRAARMKAMVLSFRLLPVSLFWNTGPRWSVDDSSNRCNGWIPIEPSKSELTMTPFMEVAEQYLILDFGHGVGNNANAQVVGIHELKFIGQSEFAFITLVTGAQYNVKMLGSQDLSESSESEDVKQRCVYYLINEKPLAAISNSSTRGALFRQYVDATGNASERLCLIYDSPIELRHVANNAAPSAPMPFAEIVPSNVQIAVKYGTSGKTKHRFMRLSFTDTCLDPISNFSPYPRRPFRGASLQGAVPMVMLGAIAATASFACLIAFIVVMATPPHKFSHTAQSLLISWLVIWFGALILCFAWGGFIIPVMFRMSYASFESDWDASEAQGWWGRYVRLERALGRAEHRVYASTKRMIGQMRKIFLRNTTKITAAGDLETSTCEKAADVRSGA